MLPDGIEASNALILKMDQCLLAGFTNLDYGQQESLQTLGQIFAGTPLSDKITNSLNDLIGGIFQPEAFMNLAVARAAIQGAQYDRLNQQLNIELGRSADSEPAPLFAPVEKVPPLLDGVRHWLMDIAITGFSRLESATITAFFPTLAEIQAHPSYLRTASILTGFVNELLKQPEDIPLFRWCDLWTRAMLTTLTTNPPQISNISGTFYPLGIQRQQHVHLISLIPYGVLEIDGNAAFVKTTLSAFKVEAIQGEQLWLLFPQAVLILESLISGKALKLDDMPCRADGNLLWDENAATLGKSYKLMEVALKYFGAGAAQPIKIWELPPEQRHPVHLAVPIALSNYQFSSEAEGWFIKADERIFKLDERRIIGTEVGVTEIEGANQLFGLVRFDAGEWVLQPLSVSSTKGKPIFIGKESSKIMKKPPKDSTVSILKERASRLLRNKA